MLQPKQVKERIGQIQGLVKEEKQDFEQFSKYQRKKITLLRKYKRRFDSQEFLDAFREMVNSQLQIISAMRRDMANVGKLISILSSSEREVEGVLLGFFRERGWETRDAEELLHELKYEHGFEEEIEKVRKAAIEVVGEIEKGLGEQKAQLEGIKPKGFRTVAEGLLKLSSEEREKTKVLRKLVKEGVKELKKYFSLQSLSYTHETKLVPEIERIWETGLTPENLVFVHMTNYFPSNGVMRTRISSDYAPRNSLHFTTNAPVGDVGGIVNASWEGMKFCVLIPGSRFPFKRIVNFARYDTYIFGNLRLPSGTVIITHQIDALREAKRRGFSFDDFIEYYKGKGIVIHIIERKKNTYDAAIEKIRDVGREVRDVSDYGDPHDRALADRLDASSVRHSELPHGVIEDSIGKIIDVALPYLRDPKFYKKKFLLSERKQFWKNTDVIGVELGFSHVESIVNLLGKDDIKDKPKLPAMTVALLVEYFERLLRVLEYQYNLLKEYEGNEEKMRSDDDLGGFFKCFCADPTWYEHGMGKSICREWKVLPLPRYIKEMYPGQSRSIESDIKKIDKLIKWFLALFEEFEGGREFDPGEMAERLRNGK